MRLENYTLGELTHCLNSARRPIKSSDRVPGATPYYGASGVVDWVEGHTHEGEFLLVSEDGENLRSRSTPIAFLATGTIWVNNHAHVLIGKEKHDTRFLAYALAETDVTGYLTGSAQPKLSKSAMESIRLRLPSTDSRRSIAEVLGALDDKIVANDRVIDTAAALGRALFERAMSQTGVANRLKLAELARAGGLVFGDGYRTKRSEHAPDGFRILRAGDVSHDRVRMTGSDYVAQSYERAIGSKVASPGDVVLTTKGTVGRVGVVPTDVEPAVYSPQVCYFRAGPGGRVDRGYLTAWLMSRDLQQQVEVRMFKSDMAPYVNLQDVGSLEVPDLPVTIQQEVGARQLLLDEQIHVLDRENRALARTRDVLLPLLMSGKLRVKDAETAVEEVV